MYSVEYECRFFCTERQQTNTHVPHNASFSLVEWEQRGLGLTSMNSPAATRFLLR